MKRSRGDIDAALEMGSHQTVSAVRVLAIARSCEGGQIPTFARPQLARSLYQILRERRGQSVKIAFQGRRAAPGAGNAAGAIGPTL